LGWEQNLFMTTQSALLELVCLDCDARCGFVATSEEELVYPHLYETGEETGEELTQLHAARWVYTFRQAHAGHTMQVRELYYG